MKKILSLTMNLNDANAIQEFEFNDPISHYRNEFFIPKNREGRDLIYYCGNSLGLLSKRAEQAIRDEVSEWRIHAVEGHLHAKNPWLPYHEFLTEPMASLVGAKPTEVVMMNGLTTNLHLMLVSFYRPTKHRHKILIEPNAFPSDRYAIESQIRFHGFDPKESLIILQPEGNDQYISKENIASTIENHHEELSLILIGSVNYYSGQAYPLEFITKLGHRMGAKVGFDLAHGAGNLCLELHDAGPDFAVWCGYKYLNGGPGCIAGCFVHERHHGDDTLPRFAGWWGHDKSERFEMLPEFKKIPTAEAWQLSNPPIMAMAAMRKSLEIFNEAGIEVLRKKSLHMHNLLRHAIEEWNHPAIKIITPKADDEKGCQLSIQMQKPNRAVFNQLINHDIIADWRAPDVIRIAPVPLYNNYAELHQFFVQLKKIIETNA